MTITSTEAVEPVQPAPSNIAFVAQRNGLADALATVSRMAKQGGIAALAGVRFQVTNGRLSLAATDLELSAVAEVSVEEATDGTCVIPAKLVAEVVRSMGTPISFSSDGSTVTLRADRAHFEIRSYPLADFPVLAPPSGESIALETKGFAAALAQVVRAASNDAGRAILTGVLFSAAEGTLRMVATDSYRLAIRDLPGSGQLAVKRPLIVPARALSELMRLLSTTESAVVQVSEADISFVVGEVTLTTRLIAGEYPAYQRLIPTPEQCAAHLTVSKVAFADAIKRVKLMASSPNTPLRLDLGGEGQLDSVDLKVVSPDAGVADEGVEATYEGQVLTVAFNPTYLLDGIEGVVGDTVVLDLVDGNKPALLSGAGDEGYQYICMPVRV